MFLNSVQSFVIDNCNGPPIENGLNKLERAPRGFIHVNDGIRFDHIKTCTLTGNFKIFIAAVVDPEISPLNYPV